METDEEKAARFRYKAAELRALAALQNDKIARALLNIAENYEVIADEFEPQRMFG